MIKIINCDITSIKSGLVAHGCNTKGKMNSGVAKFVRQQWPSVYTSYMRLCESVPNTDKLLGTTQIITINNGLRVANLFTQIRYGYDGKRYADLDAIVKCVTDLCASAVSFDETDIYLPQIGCKRGGLDWEAEVLPALNKIAERFEDLTITICVYEE